jgi:hypothetical protein
LMLLESTKNAPIFECSVLGTELIRYLPLNIGSLNSYK